jgi:hypothetical protein
MADQAGRWRDAAHLRVRAEAVLVAPAAAGPPAALASVLTTTCVVLALTLRNAAYPRSPCGVNTGTPGARLGVGTEYV